MPGFPGDRGWSKSVAALRCWAFAKRDWGPTIKTHHPKRSSTHCLSGTDCARISRSARLQAREGRESRPFVGWRVTPCNGGWRFATNHPMIGGIWTRVLYLRTLFRAMPKELESSEYWSAAELIRELHVSRQTLWRWRRLRKIPVGRRFRDGQILFTAAEADSIRHYANKVEPVTTLSVNQ